MPRAIKIAALLLTAVFLVAGSFTAGYVTAGQPGNVLLGSSARAGTPLAPQGEVEDRYSIFRQAMALLESEYYDADALRRPEVVYGAIKGAIEPLGDPYTTFVTPQQASVQQEDLSGKFEGIGAVVEVRDNRLLIVAPEPGRPAERAGLLPGDHISHVDGVPTDGMSVVDAVARIRGPRGTSVTLTIKRENVPDPFDVTLVREEIKLKYVRWEMLPEGIAYLRLTTFGQVTVDFAAALREIREREPLGLVLDLRNNPGGYLDTAVDVASQFLAGGVVVYQEGRDGEREAYEVKRGGLLKDTPMAVLVNRGSASASEIVAGALQDHGRAVLVGETTFGKGSVQRIHTLSDKSSLRITVSRWFTPSGKALHETGLEPDIFVASPESLPASHGADVQLQRAVQHLLLQRVQTAPSQVPAQATPVS